MKQILSITRLVAVGTLVASALTAVPVQATPGSGFGAAGIVNGHFGTLHVNTAGDKTDKWGMILNTLDDTDIGADRLTIQPGGYSGWHAHPSPVFITVTQGSIEEIDAALCTPHTYTVGQSFVESAYSTHNVRNTGGAAAQFVAIVIKPVGYVGPSFRLDRPQPSSC